jgi:hypothetical protein
MWKLTLGYDNRSMLAHQKKLLLHSELSEMRWKWEELYTTHTQPSWMVAAAAAAAVSQPHEWMLKLSPKQKYLTGMGNCFKNLYQIFFYIWKKAYKLTLPKGERGVRSVRAMIYFQVEECTPSLLYIYAHHDEHMCQCSPPPCPSGSQMVSFNCAWYLELQAIEPQLAFCAWYLELQSYWTTTWLVRGCGLFLTEGTSLWVANQVKDTINKGCTYIWGGHMGNT